MMIRVVIAVVCVLVFWAVFAPLMRILGFPVSGDVLLIARALVAGIAVFYILTGRTS
jgi:hypothetical protein